jgi:hypothetical protein
MSNRLIQNGKVAVLYSTGYGAGWYTWNTEYGTDLLFDSGIVDLVLARQAGQLPTELEAYITLKYPNAYLGGVRDLEVRWVPVGTKFRIDEYDGSESIVLFDEDDWVTA